MKAMIMMLMAILLDILVGDPANWPHPISLIGQWIKVQEKWLRSKKKATVIGGGLLFIGTIVPMTIVITFILEVAELVNPIVKDSVTVYLLFTSLAATCLRKEVMKVGKALREEGLIAGRKALSYLVGRDTKELSQEEVIKGAVETAAENTIDGVLAPLFYMVIGAMIGYPVQVVFIYKAINTLDSMVGYIQEPFKDIGRISAKVDDIANYIPARIGSAMMWLVGGIRFKSLKRGLKIWQRDCRNHKSPNAGHPESVVAGVLGIQLGGTHTYFGKVLYKPTIGDAMRTVTVEDLDATTKIMYMSEGLMVVIILVVGSLYKLMVD